MALRPDHGASSHRNDGSAESYRKRERRIRCDRDAAIFRFEPERTAPIHEAAQPFAHFGAEADGGSTQGDDGDIQLLEVVVGNFFDIDLPVGRHVLGHLGADSEREIFRRAVPEGRIGDAPASAPSLVDFAGHGRRSQRIQKLPPRRLRLFAALHGVPDEGRDVAIVVAREG